MTARTTPAKVISILDSNYDGETLLDPKIEVASVLVDKVVACMSRKGLTAHDATTLEMIERYLAAHLYLFHDKVMQSESKGRASGSFQGQTGMGLQSTDYGQMAITLDDSGCLQQLDLGKGPKASLKWGGKAVSSQIPYRDRD